MTAEWIVTPRQAEVLTAMVTYGRAKVAAKHLGLAPGTVEGHVSEALRRFGGKDGQTLPMFVEWGVRLRLGEALPIGRGRGRPSPANDTILRLAARPGGCDNVDVARATEMTPQSAGSRLAQMVRQGRLRVERRVGKINRYFKV
jgi:hypothetical protein